MEGLKKNLHFVVFGAGVLLGLVLLGVAYLIATDKLTLVESTTAKLPQAVNLPSRQDVKAAKERRALFDAKLSAAEDALTTGAGVSLKTEMRTFNDTDQFWDAEAGKTIPQLEARFAKLERPIVVPKELGARVLPVDDPSEPFWTRTKTDMKENKERSKIPEHQVQLRILAELCITCERLCALDAFKERGMRLVEVQFKFNNTESVSIEEPWIKYAFEMKLCAQPSFCDALVSELCNPSKLTAGDPTKAANGLGRWLFPMDLDDVQLAMRQRPMAAVIDIPLEERNKYGISPDADEAALKAKSAELAPKFREDVRQELPVDCGIRASVLYFNKAWRPYAGEPTTP